MQVESLSGGFADPAVEAASAFRAIMEAMARPGTIRSLEGVVPPPPLSVAAGAVLLTLCDADTPVHLAGAVNCAAVRDWLAFHTGAPIAGPETCMFAVGAWTAVGPVSKYPIGTPEYPDRSTTLIVELADFEGQVSTLRGPGIKDTQAFALPETAAFQANRAHFPLGLDFFFASGSQLAALPRSTEVF